MSHKLNEEGKGSSTRLTTADDSNNNKIHESIGRSRIARFEEVGGVFSLGVWEGFGV
jgi:hypothetical protein